MDLQSEAAERAYYWLLSQYESDPKWQESLPSRINTRTLYNHYASHCNRRKKVPVSIEDLWAIIQLVWPWVKVVGEDKGNRRFTAIRRKS
jgi:hypothetical protein